MCCIHCSETENQYVMPSGRTFPSAPDNMASALNSSLYNHMLSCPGLPERLRRVIPVVRKIHSQQCSSLVFGSQRRFFNRVFARLKKIPVDNALVAPEADVKPQNLGTKLLETLREYSFVYRPAQRNSSTNPIEYWQCMECRMVPFEYRAPGSLYFACPSVAELKEHCKACLKDDMYWDTIQWSLSGLNAKYAAGNPLLDREPFRQLLWSVVGDNQTVFDTVIGKLGLKSKASELPSSRGLWRLLQSSIDLKQVEEAFAILKNDLNLGAGTLTEFPDFLEFLQLLQCNFQLPASPAKQLTENGRDTESQSLIAENHRIGMETTTVTRPGVKSEISGQPDLPTTETLLEEMGTTEQHGCLDHVEGSGEDRNREHTQVSTAVENGQSERP